MKTIVFFLEEESAKTMLKTIVPKLDIQNNNIYKYIAFQGKSDLDKKIEKKIRLWQTPDTHFIILRDKDSNDCGIVKANLMEKCISAGKQDKCLIRISCHELESFYLGDLNAINRAFNLNLTLSEKYRNPDALPNAKQILKKETNDTYQPIGGSQKIAKYLNLDGSNKSCSFNVLISGLKKIIYDNA